MESVRLQTAKKFNVRLTDIDYPELTLEIDDILVNAVGALSVMAAVLNSNEFHDGVMSRLDIPHFRQVEYIRDLAESTRDLIARARKLTLYKVERF